MSKIKVLDPQIYNKISAGEVVERPSSVVKELVENSIDSGANHVVVDIISGGLRSIKVIDNGSGISPDDIERAFLPHATSKIKQADDLSSIATLGFRGEALASIASISMVTVRSRERTNTTGIMLELKAGVVVNKEPCSLNEGTSIHIENLFFNTPARLKFMKKPKSEEGYIHSLISNLIIANPHIAIELIADGKTLLSSNGRGLFDAISSVYDKEFTDNLIPLDYIKGSYSIKGYIGNKSFSKSNRTYQTIIINGRVINNQIISSAATKAYGNTMMTRCYPVFILDIVMPFESVDVNVHPAKAEVRFKDNNIIYGIVYSAFSRTLAAEGNILPTVNINDLSEIEQEVVCDKDIPSDNNDYTSYIQPLTKSKVDKGRLIDIIAESSRRTKILSESEGISAQILENIFKHEKVRDSHINQEKIEPATSEYKIIGQLFNTYLMVEYKGDALIIDQHAAMESINYDNLISGIDNDNNIKQPLLVPYILNVNHYESDFVYSYIDEFNKIGIEIDEFGNNSYRISTVPAVLSDINLETFFKLALSELIGYNSVKLSAVIKDKLAQIACKSSIKSGDKLNEHQIKILLDRFTEDKIPLKCPHGRPAVIRLTRSELDKWFKRIV